MIEQKQKLTEASWSDLWGMPHKLGSTINQSINPILIRVYPHKWGWPDLPHSNSNLSNALFCSPSPIASSTSSLVILASSCPSLQTRMLFSKHAHHLTSTHACTISLHSPLSPEPLFPSIPTSPLGPLSFFSPSVLHYTLLSPLLSQSFSKLSFHFPSNTVSYSHIQIDNLLKKSGSLLFILRVCKYCCYSTKHLDLLFHSLVLSVFT